MEDDVEVEMGIKRLINVACARSRLVEKEDKIPAKQTSTRHYTNLS